MQCDFDALKSILPQWLRYALDPSKVTRLEEIRFRVHSPVELVYNDNCYTFNKTICRDDIVFCINTASRYSPWSADTIRFGYITAPGGHRVGICGNVVSCNNQMTGVRTPSSLCIRVARDYYGLAENAKEYDG